MSNELVRFISFHNGTSFLRNFGFRSTHWNRNGEWGPIIDDLIVKKRHPWLAKPFSISDSLGFNEFIRGNSFLAKVFLVTSVMFLLNNERDCFFIHLPQMMGKSLLLSLTYHWIIHNFSMNGKITDHFVVFE